MGRLSKDTKEAMRIGMKFNRRMLCQILGRKYQYNIK
jgi:hypothetical protein